LVVLPLSPERFDEPAFDAGCFDLLADSDFLAGSCFETVLPGSFAVDLLVVPAFCPEVVFVRDFTVLFSVDLLLVPEEVRSFDCWDTDLLSWLPVDFESPPERVRE
jgi:hypothetical protein